MTIKNRATSSRAKALAFLATLVIGAPAFADTHEWTYSGATGPTHWSQEDPSFSACGPGADHHQSPINIDHATVKDLPPIQFGYKPTALKVTDTGHSFQVNAAEGSGGITIGDDHYELVQFHFHQPSEERFHGHHDSMVVHLVHKNAKGELAVVAVLIRSGHENAFLKPIFDNFPPRGTAEKEVPGATVNVDDLLPKSQGYYTFTGSLTTPPCSEGVRWFELKTPVEASAAQIHAFAVRYGKNARPTQPLNGRSIEETKN